VLASKQGQLVVAFTLHDLSRAVHDYDLHADEWIAIMICVATQSKSAFTTPNMHGRAARGAPGCSAAHTHGGDFIFSGQLL
jgi:hypothetical protein